ncbi:MAG TPA: DMT family transporter [Mycobacteriales bacterium]
MSRLVLAAGLALVAAASFALSSALKHMSAAHAPDPLDRGLASGLRAFVAYTLRHPLWLAGIITDVVGLALQVTALRLGGLVLVQPLLVTAVAETLVLRRVLSGLRQHRTELLLALMLVAGLVSFEACIDPRHAASSPADRAPAYVLGLMGLVLVVGALVVAVVRRGGRVATALLGGASGLLYAAAAALITLVVAQVAHDGLVAPFRRDELYVLVAVAVVAQVLNQTAFQAGELAIAAPTSASADLIASVVLGVVVFNQPVPQSPWRLLGVAAGALAVLIAVVTLARIEPKAEPRSAGS